MANDVQQGKALGEFAAKQGVKTVAIVDDRTAYGQGLADEFRKAAEAAGIPIMEGSLADFDVPTLLQTVAVGRQYCELQLCDEHAVVGSIRVKAGVVVSAAASTTTGLPAMQLMVRLTAPHWFRLLKLTDSVGPELPVGTLEKLLLHLLPAATDHEPGDAHGSEFAAEPDHHDLGDDELEPPTLVGGPLDRHPVGQIADPATDLGAGRPFDQCLAGQQGRVDGRWIIGQQHRVAHPGEAVQDGTDPLPRPLPDRGFAHPVDDHGPGGLRQWGLHAVISADAGLDDLSLIHI